MAMGKQIRFIGSKQDCDRYLLSVLKPGMMLVDRNKKELSSFSQAGWIPYIVNENSRIAYRWRDGEKHIRLGHSDSISVELCGLYELIDSGEKAIATGRLYMSQSIAVNENGEACISWGIYSPILAEIAQQYELLCKSIKKNAVYKHYVNKTWVVYVLPEAYAQIEKEKIKILVNGIGGGLKTRRIEPEKYGGYDKY